MNAPTVPSTGLRSFDRLYIGGRWRAPAGDELIEVVSPSTEERLGEVPAGSPADIDLAVDAARQAFDSGAWPGLDPAERSRLLRRVADEIDARVPEMTHAFTAEVGAPLALSEMIQKMAAHFWRRNADLLDAMNFEQGRDWGSGAGTLRREPLGVVATISPWNGPTANISMKMAPALAAGCTVVAKPAREGPVSTLIMAEAIEAAGLPEGVVSIVPAGREVGEHLVGHPGVDKVSFTGSTVAGRRVMELCAGRIARVTLELGGKSAAIIADDIPFDEFLPGLVAGGIGHSGQVCAALTRVLVSEVRHDDLVEALAAAFAATKVGDPFDPATALGPLVAERQRDRVEGYLELGRSEGARVAAGGGRPADLPRGWFVEPTLFADVTNDMRIAREEIFGPVVSVLRYRDLDEAVAIANDSDYGLSGSIYATDLDLAGSLARRIRSGQVFLNGCGTTLDAPFGGYKQSGLGREGGPEGLEAFFETKLIVERGL
ncbi:aldehyde dehydrogenase [Pseudonocardia xishanensis]|uniref:Aldehyde dehydrogenase n=1 Tax=Pseudonocardia xishanensis TaxID=630995 RepID=A0ABP8RTP2_9PSEU